MGAGFHPLTQRIHAAGSAAGPLGRLRQKWRHQAPDFGRLGHNLYYLQGFSGHGLAITGMAGKLVAEAVAGQAERFDLLSRIKHRPFPGGALMRMPALMLGMLYYRLRDLL